MNSQYDPSVVLYRRARQSLQAAESAAWLQNAGSEQARAEEIDEVVLTVVLTHAALETAWHWATKDLEQGKGRWPKDWDTTLSAAATATGLHSAAPPTMQAALDKLGALRNFLQHGDDRARKRLAADWPDFQVPHSLNAAFAAGLVRDADLLFQHIAASTGGEVVGPAHSGWTPNPYRDWDV